MKIKDLPLIAGQWAWLLLRKALYPITPKHYYVIPVYSGARNNRMICGFVSSRGKTIMYGKHWLWHYRLGMIP